jgi:hypothetical protein
MGSDGLTLSIAIIVSAAAVLGLILLFIKLKGGIRVARIPGLQEDGWKTILLMIAVFIVMHGRVYGGGLLYQRRQRAGLPASCLNSSAAWAAPVVARGSRHRPVLEEAFFRGFLFTGYEESRLGAVATIIVTSLLWASIAPPVQPVRHGLKFGHGHHPGGGEAEDRLAVEQLTDSCAVERRRPGGHGPVHKLRRRLKAKKSPF